MRDKAAGVAIVAILAGLVLLGLLTMRDSEPDPFTYCGAEHWTACITATVPACDYVYAHDTADGSQLWVQRCPTAILDE